MISVAPHLFVGDSTEVETSNIDLLPTDDYRTAVHWLKKDADVIIPWAGWEDNLREILFSMDYSGLGIERSVARGWAHLMALESVEV